MENQKSWFGRNWVWAIPGCGCMGIIFFLIFGVGAAFFGIKNFINDASPYDYAVEQVITNSEVIEILGAPVETDGMMTGSVNIVNEAGSANFTVPIKGANGFGTLVVDAERFDGEWIYLDLYITIHETQKQIDLLDETFEEF